MTKPARTIKPGFHTPSASGNNGGCWDVMHNDGTVFLRDSKDDGKGPILEFTRRQWLDLIADVEAERWPDCVTLLDGASAEVRMPGVAGPFLTFDQHEMDMFAKSVREGAPQMIGPR